MTGDYRDREQQVRSLATSDAWFEQWVEEHRPGTRTSSFPYAVTFLWCVHGGGLLITSPASTPPTRLSRVACRQFAASLRPLATAALMVRARTQPIKGAA